MAGEFRKVVDDDNQLQFENPSGEFVVANRVADGWSVKARSAVGREQLGAGLSRSQAKRVMKDWMRAGSSLSVGGVGNRSDADDFLSF